MKQFNFMRVGPVLLILILFGLAQSSAAMEHALWISGGERNDYSSFSLGYSWQCYALEVGFINDVEYYSDIDYFGSWPSDYSVLGIEQRTSTGGLDLLYLFALSEQLLIYGGPGLYFYELGQTVQANDTGKKHNKYLTTETEFAYSIGLKYKLAKFQLGLGYHSIRGINGQIGFMF